MKNEIIMASAGSGKTYRLSNRIISLLLDGVDPTKIIALTFTRKAAGEFSSALFEKIALASSSEEQAARLCQDLNRPNQYTKADFLKILSSVVQVLPEIYLGTLDSYFTRVVQAFQFELGLSTGAGVKILDGAELEEVKSEILDEILFKRKQTDSKNFIQAFKLANFGKEEISVSSKLEGFVNDWHQKFLTYGQTMKWGRQEVVTQEQTLEKWTPQKATEYGDFLQETLSPHVSSDTAQLALTKVLTAIRNFSGGSGALKGLTTFINNALKIKEDLREGCETTLMFSRKKIKLTPDQSATLGALLFDLFLEELRVKGIQSDALWQVMEQYEALYDKRARKMGRLCFDDLKYILGKWQNSEEDRITRELIDYRLDARHDHWLLDEFQDTSKDQYLGLKPLLDEVGHDISGERSIFVVGDVKQAIYQWRGGDPKLFYKVASDYDIPPEDMSLSWRSQTPVLTLVNKICGNRHAMHECFGEVADRWEWRDHHQACGEKPSYAEVRILDNSEEKQEHLLELLSEVQPTKRNYSCAILVRENKNVGIYAELLRSEGFLVAEKGAINPSQDNPVGLLLCDTLKWLNNPNDTFALRHLQMSPLGETWRTLRESPAELWAEWTQTLRLKGLLATLEDIFHTSLQHISAFGLERWAYLIEEVRNFQGSISQLIKHLEHLNLTVGEASNVIQVMTIHQSKGLGFDMVILPEISKDTVAHGGKFSFAHLVSEFGSTIFSTPPTPVCEFFEVLKEAKVSWQQEQYYEAFCVLYVALTRAKQGIYCFLEPQPKKVNSFDNFSQWIYHALPPQEAVSSEGLGDLLFQVGDPVWFQERTSVSHTPSLITPPSTAPLVLPLKRGRASIARHGQPPESSPFIKNKALERGLTLHEAMEQIEWLPFESSSSSSEVIEFLDHPDMRPLFERPHEPSLLYREQTIEWIDKKGLWNTIRIDRFWIILDSEGHPKSLHLLDFKTDNITSDCELQSLYKSQFDHYKSGLRAVYGQNIPITCYLTNLTHSYYISW